MKLIICDAVHALVIQEPLDLEVADVSVPASINSLEGRVGSEISNTAKSLTSCFKTLFTVANSDQEVLEIAF